MSTIKSSPLSESYQSIEDDENIFSPEQTPKSQFTTPSTLPSKLSFEQRARSSSPAAKISKHATDSREKRKSRFLDRIRSRREDKRDDRMGDQILRMDYVKERREWEEQMAQQATEVDEDVVMEEEPSPTEDKEIEELVSYFEQPERADQRDGPPGQHSDDEYDQLFIELSASQNDTKMDMS